MDEPPTAFLLLDQWCHIVREMLLENGFDIPGDLSLAGSLRYSAQENLSAAWFDLEEIYCTALEQLFKSMDDPGAEKKGQLIAPRFLEGNTIGPAVPPDLNKWKKLW
jgi:DNA-binding LacI/PurR family transcriptional regulator